MTAGTQGCSVVWQIGLCRDGARTRKLRRRDLLTNFVQEHFGQARFGEKCVAPGELRAIPRAAPGARRQHDDA